MSDKEELKKSFSKTFPTGEDLRLKKIREVKMAMYNNNVLCDDFPMIDGRFFYLDEDNCVVELDNDNSELRRSSENQWS